MPLSSRYTGLIDKYRDRLPVHDDTRVISLGEGNTPLIRLHNVPRMIGKVSYSLYLLHLAVLIVLTPLILQGLEPVLSSRSGLWLSGWLLTIGCSLALARLSYRYLEKPGMAAGRYLGDG